MSPLNKNSFIGMILLFLNTTNVMLESVATHSECKKVVEIRNGYLTLVHKVATLQQYRERKQITNKIQYRQKKKTTNTYVLLCRT
jgi:phage-related tail fiber protein